MSVSTPIIRDDREQTLVASDGQTVFGPLDFALIDAADIAVFAMMPDEGPFARVDPSLYEVTLSEGGFPTVTFAEGRADGEIVRLAGARVHERLTDATLGGVIRSAALEGELDAQALVLQELRRDADRALAIDAAGGPGGGGGPTDWALITGKPSTFPAAWGEVLEKPETFPSTWDEVSGKPSSFPVAWTDVTGKPAFADILTVDRVYYVNADTGSDGNTGLSSGQAFETFQRAVDAAAALNLNNYSVFIQLEDATAKYDSGDWTYIAGVGSRGRGPESQLVILGNPTNPENVVVTGTLAALAVEHNAIETHLGGVTIENGVAVGAGGDLIIVRDGPVIFAAATGPHALATLGGTFGIWDANYEIAGGSAVAHFYAEDRASIRYLGIGGTIPVTGTPDFGFFAYASSLASIDMGPVPPTFDGAATGFRYSVDFNAVIKVAGEGVDYFPGDSEGGLDDTGGQYG